MSFSEFEVFNVNEITEFLDEFSSENRANMLIKKIKDFVFYDNCVLYTYDKSTISYKKHYKDSEDDIIITLGVRFLTQSLHFIKLNKLNYEMLQKVYKTQLKHLCTNDTIRKILSQLRTGLKNDGIFKPLFNQIHYKNGYIDITTLTFKQREFKKDYTYFYIDREYKKSTQEQMDKINADILYKIYPKKEDCEAIKHVLGSALTGKATREQMILILLGRGSSGKSTILTILQKALTDCYFQKMESIAFNENNPNKDKTLSAFIENINVLLIWCNEPKTTKLDTELLKEFCEGTGKCKLLYKNGTHHFSHNGLLVFTENIMPSFINDSGIARRFKGYEHTSLFTSDNNITDTKNHIYKKDEDLIDKIVQEGKLDTFIDILLPYAKEFYEGKRIQFPESFKDTTNEILEMNDEWAEFIEKKLIVTGKDTDIINKDNMKKLYDNMFPKKVNLVNEKIILARLKEKNIRYNKEKKHKNVKGCYIGVREQISCDIINESDDDDKNYELKKEIEEKNKIIIKLQKQIDELRFHATKKATDELLDDANKPIENEVITTTDVEETTDLDEDSEEEEYELVIYNNEKYYKDCKDNIYGYDEEEVGELIGIFVNGEVILNKTVDKKIIDEKHIDNCIDEFDT